MSIKIHRLTDKPTLAWNEISKNQKILKLNVKIPTKEKSANKIRIVCMSDTHSLTHHIKFDIPEGDIFIHAGDFTSCGGLKEVIDFNNWIGNFCILEIISPYINFKKFLHEFCFTQYQK